MDTGIFTMICTTQSAADIAATLPPRALRKARNMAEASFRAGATPSPLISYEMLVIAAAKTSRPAAVERDLP